MPSDPDDKNWEDVEPPPSDGEDDESIDVVKDDEKEGPPKGNSGGRFDVRALQFTPDELPLLGYAIASFLFFLAAVTRKQKKAPDLSLDMDFSPELNYNTILGDVYMADDNTGNRKLMDSVSQTIIQGCEASYNALCGNTGWFGGVAGGYGSTLPTSQFAYALCLGIFGVLMGAGVIVWKRTSKSIDRVVDNDDDDAEDEDDTNANRAQLEGFLGQHLWVVNSILLLWAGIGWAFFTFGGNEVFAYTGNGFFALWAMLLCAVWNLGFTSEDLFKESENTNSCVYALVATSVVTIIELTTGLGGWKYRSNRGISAYALAVSVISITFGLVIAGFSVMAARGSSSKLDVKISFWCLLVIAIMKAIAAFLTTFVGPFLTTGNGYFAVWGSVLFSGIACSKLRKEMLQDMA